MNGLRFEQTYLSRKIQILTKKERKAWDIYKAMNPQ